MTIKELYDSKLKTNPEGICRIAAERVMGWKLEEVENFVYEGIEIEGSKVWKTGVGVDYFIDAWQPHKDLNQVRELEDKIKPNRKAWFRYDVCIFDEARNKYPELLSASGRLLSHSEASNLRASNKLYCILLAVLDEEELRKELGKI